MLTHQSSACQFSDERNKDESSTAPFWRQPADILANRRDRAEAPIRKLARSYHQRNISSLSPRFRLSLVFWMLNQSRSAISLRFHSSMNASFAEKVVLITGGTSGIGRATAVAFAEQGANVVISGRREAEGAESVSLIQKAGGQGLFVRGDVSAESEIEALVAKTLERFGRLDFAFNNAGVGGEGRATMTATADIYNRIMDINVRGVFFSMKHQIPAILQSGGGAIINNASVLALRPSANSPIYSASKWAVVGLTKSAALELAPKGIRVNAICPAIIETDLTQQIRSDEQSRAYMLARHPVGRFGRSEEVAAAVLYLCSPEASFITGVALPLDGGFSA
jgi:NAD(P)-dependent dehydrogenase (short-subunit alcohol dehydrogenase family)